jgi:hypothetical protein
LSLCFNWAPRHEGVLGEWRYSSTHSLIWALDGGERSALHPGRFTPRERAHGTHWIGNCLTPESFWTRWWKEKFPVSPGNRTLEHQCPAPSPALYRLSYHGSYVFVVLCLIKKWICLHGWYLVMQRDNFTLRLHRPKAGILKFLTSNLLCCGCSQSNTSHKKCLYAKVILVYHQSDVYSTVALVDIRDTNVPSFYSRLFSLCLCHLSWKEVV